MASFDVPRKIVGNTAGIILYQIVGPDHELSSGQIVLQ